MRELCDKHGLLLVLDEVQTGVGRTGKLFAHEWAGITPDVMAIAKGLGGGFPVGAVLATAEAAKGMTPGTHGSTFGGNPLAMAVASTVLGIVSEPDFLEAVRTKALHLKQGLSGLKDQHADVVEDVRGSGLLMGLKLKSHVTPAQVVKAAAEEKLLIVGAGDNSVRAPPASRRLGQGNRGSHANPIARAVACFARGPLMLKKAPTLMTAKQSPRHFLDIADLDAKTLRKIIDTAHAMKRAGKRVPAEFRPKGIEDAVLVLIFEKPSTRTRVSFDIAMRQLGGGALTLNHTDLQLGRGESVADTARVLSRYADGIMIRANAHATLAELARHATIPVINGLTEKSHPCQVMADIQTFEEHLGPIKGRTIAWVGDGNNVAVSWMHAAVRFDFTLKLACPKPLFPEAEFDRLGAPGKRQSRNRYRSRSRRSKVRTASSPTPGCRWGSPMPPNARKCWLRTRSTPS